VTHLIKKVFIFPFIALMILVLGLFLNFLNSVIVFYFGCTICLVLSVLGIVSTLKQWSKIKNIVKFLSFILNIIIILISLLWIVSVTWYELFNILFQ
jgi:hypothetical protein